MEVLRRLTPNQAVLQGLRSGTIRNETSLSEVRQLLSECGLDAQPDAPICIHVAGTKGKGGVCAMLERLFRLVAGRRTALFTSPHLVHPGERIRIDGMAMSEAELAQIVDGLERRVESKTHLTYFRMLLLAFYERMRTASPQVAIIEVGIGGRFDATNVLHRPSAAAITMLGLEHTAVLGDTIEAIAGHKAGIIKAGCPAFTIPQESGAMRVLEEEARLSGSQLTVVDEALPLAFPGGVNAALALRLFLQFYPEADRAQCLAVLMETKWPGRQQTIVHESRLWFLDGAHTVESLLAVLSWLHHERKQDNMGPSELWFHCSSDRDWRRLLGVLMERRWDRVLLVPPSDADSSHYEGIEKEMGSVVSVERCKDVVDAVARSESKAVLATGSLHLVGALLAHLGISADSI